METVRTDSRGLTRLADGTYRYRGQAPSLVFRATKAQRDFIKSQARFKALIAGIGAGKTAAGAVTALIRIRAGHDGIICAPNYPHYVKSTQPEFEKWRALCAGLEVVEANRSERWDRYNTGARVFYGGIDDPDAWRGPNVTWCWFDEGARHRSRRSFDILAGRIRVAPEPQMWVTTTPRGKTHWLYEVFVEQRFSEEVLEAAGGAGRLVAFFHSATHENRANLDPFYLASLRAMYSGRFAAQELEGQFVAFEGQVYEDFNEQNIAPEADFDPARGVVEWAYDDGFTNPRVILFIQRGEDGRVFLFDEVYATKEQGAETISRALSRPWPRPDLAVGDPSAAAFKDALRRADIVARSPKTGTVVEGIKETRRAVCDGNGRRWLFVHPRCVNFIREVNAYVYPEGGEERNENETPVKAHDHGPDALRYWIWTRWRKTNTVEG